METGGFAGPVSPGGENPEGRAAKPGYVRFPSQRLNGQHGLHRLAANDRGPPFGEEVISTESPVLETEWG